MTPHPAIDIPGYKIERRVAEGGMASVYLAVQESLNRYVALKMLKEFDSPAQSQRFFNEGRLIASLNHRNIITIHDIGAVGNQHYLSMEYIEGGNLEQRILNGIPADTALDILEVIAECLEFVHHNDIVHRDIKPANILFREDGTPVLTDFGIAKQLHVDNRLTSEGIALGTPYYLSPEQAECNPLDGRADIYSLGVVFYEMLAGHKPYHGGSHIETIIAHLTEPVPSLPQAVHLYQPLVERMLAKRPNDRLPSAGDLAREIRLLRQTGPKNGLAAAVSSSYGTGPELHSAAQTTRVDNGTVRQDRDTRAQTSDVDQTLSDTAWWRRQLSPQRVSKTILSLSMAAGVVIAAFVSFFLLTSDHASEQGAESRTTISATESIPVDPPTVTTDGVATHQIPETSSAVADSPGVDHVGETPSEPQPWTAMEPNPSEPPAAMVVQSNTAFDDRSPVRALAESNGKPTQAADDGSLTETMAQGDPSVQIRQYLVLAQQALDQYRLTTPPNNSAHYFYQKVLEQDPDHEEALLGMMNIADHYADLVESELDSFRYAKARLYVSRGLTIHPDNRRLLLLAEQTSATKDAPKRLLGKIKSIFE